MIDLEAIKSRHEKAHDSVHSAHSDRGVLIAEVERLRAEADLLRTGIEATRAYADRVEAELLSLRGERAAVVAWLHRMERNARHWGGKDDERADIYTRLADVFECGEHRKEES